MKSSDLKKDIRTTIRLSSAVKNALSQKGISVQSAFDSFIDANLFFEILPNQGQNNQEKTMAKKVTKKAVKNDKKKPGKTKASKQSGASKASKK
jgi:hypothetical protein